MDSDTARECFRRRPAGVTIVTARHGDALHGATVTSITPVTLVPPRLLVCLARTSRTRSSVLGSGRFAVNLLSDRHRELAVLFSDASASSSLKFGAAGSWDVADEWGPSLLDAPAVFHCRVYSVQEVDSHSVIIGTIDDAVRPERASDGALAYLAGTYLNLRSMLPAS